ncbi:MAG: flagellar filament capping protein FliD [Candidatus Obscuribacterales bacterium]|nr:flagellar filament capping protein FliD [Steroidobacteraceae bacterium]
MATLQSPGVGSGLDVNSLVQQLVAVERAPTAQRIARQQQGIATTISALGSLKGALGSFQSALDALKSVDNFKVRSAKSSDETVFSATAATTAVAGQYSIKVTQIAKAHQIASNAFATGSSQVVGTGSLTVSLGATSMVLQIGATNNPVAGIRDAINSASNNPGVAATIVTATDGAHLVLTSTKTGAVNAIKVTQSGGDGGLAALVYDPPGTVGNYTVPRPAHDSIVEVAGFVKQGATNSVDGIIEGVTLTLKKEVPATTYTLDVAIDQNSTIERVKNFVAQYNSAAAQIAKLRSYDASTQATGALFGDAMLTSIESQLRRGISNPVSGLSGDYTTLASLGIRTKADGTLELDSAKLTAALNKNSDAAGNVFAGSGGVATRLWNLLDPVLKSNGTIDSRNQGLDKTTKDVEKQRIALDVRMASVEARYMRQFTALDQVLTRLQSTSSFLTQQLTQIAKIK